MEGSGLCELPGDMGEAVAGWLQWGACVGFRTPGDPPFSYKPH